MPREVDLLLISNTPQRQCAILEILKRLLANVAMAQSADDAKRVLEKCAMAIVICDPHLADSTYHDVLAHTAGWQRKIPVVAMLASDSWDEYREALSAVASGAVRWANRAIDVELALIGALRQSVAAAGTEV